MAFSSTLKRWLPIRILDFYLARQLLLSTLMAVLVLSVVLVLGQIFRALFELVITDRLPMSKLPGLIWDMFSNSLSYTLPWGMLTGVLLLFGRLSADNELTSMRMAGVSLFRISLPVIVLAFIMSGICLWVNTSVAPRAYKELKTQQKSLALENPIAMFLPKTIMDSLDDYIIYCDAREDDVLHHFQAFNLVGEGDVPALGPIILAEKATLKADLEKKAINAEFENMLTLTHQFEDYDESGKKLTPEQVLALKAAGGTFRTVLAVSAPVRSRNSPQALDLSKKYNKATRPRVAGLTMNELKEVYSSTSRGATGEGVTDPSIREYIATLNSNQRKILSSECLTTYNSRYSFSLACITLTLVGISFGITAQRRDTSSGFILSLVVVIFYFGFIMLGELLKGTPKMKPELWVWLPNVIFGGLGVFMFWKHQRR